MDNESKIEPYYQMQGKEVVDTLFNSDAFHERLTRDDMNGLENLLAFMFQSQANSVKRGEQFLAKIRKIDEEVK